MSTISTSLSFWASMTAVNITGYNVNVGLDTYSLFVQSRWMLPFAQACSFILPSCFSVRNISDSIAFLRSWLVILCTSIGLKHVMACILFTYDNAAYNPLSP